MPTKNKTARKSRKRRSLEELINDFPKRRHIAVVVDNPTQDSLSKTINDLFAGGWEISCGGPLKVGLLDVLIFYREDD